MKKTTQKTYIRKGNLLRSSARVSLLLLALLTLGFIAPISIDRGEAIVSDEGAAESILTLETDSALASVNLATIAAGGSFAASETGASFAVSTTNYTGYTLLISSKNPFLSNINSDYKIASIPSALDLETFDTAAYNNMWGYLPSKFNSGENENYLPAPAFGDILDVTNAPNENANTYTIGMGVRADYASPAGVYESTFIVTAVANPVNYQIAYSDTTADATVENLPKAQSGNTSAASVILSSTVPTRLGYTFKGWCHGEIEKAAPENAETSAEVATACKGTVYAPSATFGIDQSILNDVTLTALWEKTAAGTLNSPSSLNSAPAKEETADENSAEEVKSEEETEENSEDEPADEPETETKDEETNPE